MDFYKSPTLNCTQCRQIEDDDHANQNSICPSRSRYIDQFATSTCKIL